jgi:hypothetical protein
VVDSSDTERIGIAKEEFHSILEVLQEYLFYYQFVEYQDAA